MRLQSDWAKFDQKQVVGAANLPHWGGLLGLVMVKGGWMIKLARRLNGCKTERSEDLVAGFSVHAVDVIYEQVSSARWDCFTNR